METKQHKALSELTTQDVECVPGYSVAGYKVEFYPVSDVPGWTHRVLIDGQPADWLSCEFNPSKKTALFYAQKHCS